MSKSTEQVVKDIGNFYAQKLHRITNDTIDICERIDIDDHESILMVMSVLGSHMFEVAHCAGIDHEDFVKLCDVGYKMKVERER
jgi:hypothetical protein